jgi:hypothetical protein
MYIITHNSEKYDTIDKKIIISDKINPQKIVMKANNGGPEINNKDIQLIDI